MAINYVAGQMLQNNLERDGANLAVETNLLYIDVVNGRIGINKSTPSVALDVNGNVLANNISTGNLAATANVSAINVAATANVNGGNVNSSGLIVATGNINGGNLNISNKVTASTGFFTGNVDVIGNLNATVGVVYANSGIFYGNAITGIDAAFAGVPGFTPLGSNVIMQFAGNVNAYAQLNFQNINSGNASSTDYIATANNGDDSTYFIDFGITGNTHDGIHDGFFGDTSSANDGYLYIVASDSEGPGSQNVGNLILGSTNGNVKIFVGNTAEANVVAVASSGGLSVFGNLSVSSNVVANIDATDVYASNSVVTPTLTSLGNLNITSSAPGNIFIDPVGSGQLQIVGTNGFVVPVGNTAQRPANPDAGTLRFNSATLQLEVYDGTQWDSASGDASVITNQTIVPDGATDTFTLDQSTTAVAILVSINGIQQTPIVDYTVSGNQITFTTIPLISDIIQVRFIASTTTVAGISSDNGLASVTATIAPSIVFEVNGANIAEFSSANVLNISNSHSLQLPVYTVAQANALSNVATGQVIYVSNGDSGNPCLAVYSGGSFKRVSLGSTIST